jgi:glycosyltransferase involved in cell wall biosynthesis
VARLNRIKDQPTLLRAARLVADKIPGFRLDVVGDGPNNDHIRALSDELGLQESVVFHGMRDNVAELLRESDLFVLPSLSEGISITLLEAMGSSLPCVVTDVGGNREVVRDGTTGFLVPAGDHEALAARMEMLLLDDPMARTMGAAGRAVVEKEFNIEGTAAAYHDAYMELLGRSSRAGVTA